MENKEVLRKLDELIQVSLLGAKDMLSIEDAAYYTGFSKSYLYRLTSNREIPHYKPHGRTVYFKRSELNDWLSRNRVKSTIEAEAEAEMYSLRRVR